MNSPFISLCPEITRADALTLIDWYFGLVRWATVRMHPASDEAQHFKKRPQGPPYLWTVLSYLPSVVFSILGLLCLKLLPLPANCALIGRRRRSAR